MHRGEEDYIKGIYKLAMESGIDGHELVANQQLSEVFGHTPQTVSEMIKKLDRQGYISYVPYKGSHLTASGREAAIRLIRIHRTWEFFLVNQLGYTWDEVHEEAEALEHATSDRLEERLFHYLGDPTVCPLGNPIPDLEGHLEERKGMKLWFGAAGDSYEIIRVADETDLLKYLNKYNLEIGQQVEVIEQDAIGELIHLRINGQPIILGKRVASAIFVQ